MLRIDVLAELGCCCFCSILIIANDEFLAANPKRVASFMRAVKRATDLLHADPAAAWAEYCRVEKTMNTPLNFKIFERSFVYMSKDMSCVARDWNKVVGVCAPSLAASLTSWQYCKRLGVIEGEFVPNYTKYVSLRARAVLTIFTASSSSGTCSPTSSTPTRTRSWSYVAPCSPVSALLTASGQDPGERQVGPRCPRTRALCLCRHRYRRLNASTPPPP